MKKKIVMGMLILSMAVLSAACSTKKADVAKEETSQSTEIKESSEKEDKANSSEERNVYGLTEEETKTLTKLVKEKITTQYLEKYKIAPKDFSFPEYVPGDKANLWYHIDYCLCPGEVSTSVVTGEIGGLKDTELEKLSEGINDGTIAFEEQIKYDSDFYAKNSQQCDLEQAIYQGVAEFLNGLDVAERAEVLYNVYDANVYQDGKGSDEQGNNLHSMFDQVIIENISFE